MPLKPFGVTETPVENEVTEKEEVREFAGWLTPDPVKEADPEEVEVTQVEETVSEVTVDKPELIGWGMTEEVANLEDEESDLEVSDPDNSMNSSTGDFKVEEAVEVKTEPGTAVEKTDDLQEVDYVPEGDGFGLQPYYACADPRLEAILVIEAYYMSFSEGSAYKYMLRAGKKTEDALRDLGCSLDFLERCKKKSWATIRSVDPGAPTACAIIAGFNLDYFVGSAIENLLAFCTDGDASHLDKAMDMIRWKISSLKGASA